MKPDNVGPWISYILDLLSKIPSEVWNIIAGMLGWFARTLFDEWKKSRLPFKQDKERYDAVMAALNPEHLYYFREITLDSIGSRVIDGLDDAFYTIESIRKKKPKYLHKKLEELEDNLFNALHDLVEFLPKKLYAHKTNHKIYTIYFDGYDDHDEEHCKKIKEVKTELMNRVDRLIEFFESFRDEGNKLFSEKIEK